MTGKKQESFFVEVWQELKPILRHTIVFGVILAVFFLVALVFKKLEQYLPDRIDHLKWIEKGDLALLYILIFLFGIYVIAEVVVRSLSAIVSLVKKKFGRKKQIAASKERAEPAESSSVNITSKKRSRPRSGRSS